MSSSDIFIGETIGTAVLILLGGGVCAAVTLKRSKAFNAGWVAITFGWGFAVLTGAYIAAASPAHTSTLRSPSASRSRAASSGATCRSTSAGELLGAMIGAVLVWITYYGQFQAHLTDPEILGRPRRRGGPWSTRGRAEGRPGARHLLHRPGDPERRAEPATEIIATFVLVLAILTQGLNDDGNGLGVIGALITALVVVGIGLSLGGPTGYAINPVRDLGPRIVHALLPLPNKGGSDWGYAWIPVVGPLIGGAIAGGIYNVAFA